MEDDVLAQTVCVCIQVHIFRHVFVVREVGNVVSEGKVGETVVVLRDVSEYVLAVNETRGMVLISFYGTYMCVKSMTP